MKLIVMWLWGAALSSLWWLSIVLVSDKLIAFAIIASLVTLGVAVQYCANNWDT